MDLFKQELYKIFKQKAIYVVLGFFLFVSFSNTLFVFDYDLAAEQAAYDGWGGQLTDEKVEEAEVALQALRTTMEERERDAAFVAQTAEQNGNLIGVYEDIAMIDGAARNASERLAELESSGSYNAELEKSLLQNLDLSYFAYNQAPKEIIDYASFYGLAITGIMLLVGLSTIFTREYSSGVDNYILSSKKGRKSLVWAKMAAALVYTILIILIWEIASLAINMATYGNAGWATPLQHVFKYYGSPYAFDMLEFHSIQLGIHLLAAIAFTMVILFISSLSRNSLVSFFACEAVLMIPYILIEYVRMPNWLDQTVHFSFLYIMKVEFLFDSFRTINLFGYPLLYPFAAVALMIAAALIFTVSLFNVMKHKQVTS